MAASAALLLRSVKLFIGILTVGGNHQKASVPHGFKVFPKGSAEFLDRRLDMGTGRQRLVNLVQAWTLEIKEIMGGMGINSIEALRGNRLMLRGVGLTSRELSILGVKHAGE